MCYMYLMVTIGIREMRQNASKYLRLVEAGDTVQIVDRGRPVALWVPIPTTNGLERLEAEGRITSAISGVLDILPVRVSKGAPPPSETLKRMRQHER